MARIQIIDDDAEYAQNLSIVLTAAGHTVHVMGTTDNAVQTLAGSMPDLLILDVMFPGNPVAGFDLARRVRRTRGISDIPIILLTAARRDFPACFSSNDIGRDWVPVQEFVEKPVGADRLLEVVHQSLRGTP